MSRVLHTCWQLEQSHGSQAVTMVIIFSGPFGNNVKGNWCLVSGHFYCKLTQLLFEAQSTNHCHSSAVYLGGLLVPVENRQNLAKIKLATCYCHCYLNPEDSLMESHKPTRCNWETLHVREAGNTHPLCQQNGGPGQLSARPIHKKIVFRV